MKPTNVKSTVTKPSVKKVSCQSFVWSLNTYTALQLIVVHTPIYRPIPFHFCDWQHDADWSDDVLDVLDLIDQYASNTIPANTGPLGAGAQSLVSRNDQTSQNRQRPVPEPVGLADQSDQPGAWNYPMWLHYNLGNGFMMCCTRPTHPADPETVQQVVELWQQNQVLTIQQFWEKFDDVACSDWNKMQPDGKPFGGAWDLDDRDAAWNLTRYQNFVCLAKMAFPRHCLLYAVDFLCHYRCESPVQVKDWLEWIRNHVKTTHQLELVQHDDMHALEEFAQLHSVVNIQAMFDKYDI